MPVGYLVGVVVVAVGVLLALVPRRRPRPLASLSYFVGLVVNEAPFVAAYLLALSTVLAFAQGDIASTDGWLVVGIAALTMIGLGVIAARAVSTGGVIEQALRAGLGDDWRQSTDPEIRPTARDRRLPGARIVLTPFLFLRRDVERVKDVAYGPAGRSNRLDVYRNRSRPAGGPILIHFHGGHFRSGRKSREARALFARLAGHGWVCISANYRLGRNAPFPDPLIDAKMVVAWARAHAFDHGGDPSTVFVAGSSAGAHLAAMAALTPNRAGFQPGFEAADTSVTAAIGLYGYYGPLDSPAGLPSSPFDYAGADRPPFFVAHGDHDIVVSVDLARAFVETLAAGSAAPVVYAELPGAQHGFDVFHSIRFDTVVDGVESFAAWVRSRDNADQDDGSSTARSSRERRREPD